MDNEMDKQIVRKHIMKKPSEDAARSKSMARFANPDDKADQINTVAVRPTLWVIVQENRQDGRVFIVSAEETEMFEVWRREETNGGASVISLGREFVVFRKRSFHFDRENNDLVNSILVRAKAKMQARRAAAVLAPRPSMGPMRAAMVSLRPQLGSLAAPRAPPKTETISWAAMAAKAC